MTNVYWRPEELLRSIDDNNVMAVYLISALKSHTLPFCHVRSSSCKSRTLTADLHQSRTNLILSSLLLPRLLLLLRHVRFAHIAQYMTVLLIRVGIVGMRCARWFHEFLNTASTKYMSAWFGECRFRAVAESFLACRTSPDDVFRLIVFLFSEVDRDECF